MILDLAIGDAYGRPFEFNSNEYVKQFNTAKCYTIREVNEDPGLFGTYTDDTQMSIAIAEHILEDRNNQLATIAHSFVYTYNRDAHGGYSKRLLKAFADSTGKDKGEKFFNSCHTDGLVHSNGTMMRAVPIGILPTEGQVVRFAQMQSLVTHCSPVASMCSQLIAMMSHYYYYRKHSGDFSIDNLIGYLDAFGFYEIFNICVDAFKHNAGNPIPCDARITTGAVIYALLKSKTSTEILFNAVRMEGDVDSVASVAAGLGAIKDDVRIDYSKDLIVGLENGVFGKDYLESLDNQILEKFPRG